MVMGLCFCIFNTIYVLLGRHYFSDTESTKKIFQELPLFMFDNGKGARFTRFIWKKEYLKCDEKKLVVFSKIYGFVFCSSILVCALCTFIYGAYLLLNEALI